MFQNIWENWSGMIYWYTTNVFSSKQVVKQFIEIFFNFEEIWIRNIDHIDQNWKILYYAY